MPGGIPQTVCVITGATSGIGRATAKALVNSGAEVVLLGRNERIGRQLAERFSSRQSAGSAEFLAMDLADFEHVRRVAGALLRKHPRVDVLINNAGARYDRYVPGASGHEVTFAANHLGHFLLTGLLLGALRASAAGRVLTVTSHFHGKVPPEGDWELSSDRYDRQAAYARSKMANIVFASSLAEYVRPYGVTSNAYSPGAVASHFARNNGWLRWLRHLVAHGIRGTLDRPATAARGLVRLAIDASWSGRTGRYVHQGDDRGPLSTFHTPEQARQLWELSNSCVGLMPDAWVAGRAR